MDGKKDGHRSGSSREIIVQGSILAAAQLIARIIGLIYRIPLQRIAGDVAMGYYSYAFDIYSILLLLSTNGVPVAVVKLISGSRARRDAVNEKRVLVTTLIWTLIVGAAVGGLTVIFAKQLATLFFGPELVEVAPSLKVLGITIFLCCVMSTFRGYFQGLGTMIPTAVSEIVEQILNALFSVGAAWILVSQGPAYAAMGGTVGTCVGALASLIFLVITFVLYRPSLEKRVKADTEHEAQRYGLVAKQFALILVPVVLSNVFYQINSLIDSSMYSRILTSLGYSPDLISSIYGIYVSKYKTIANVPLPIAYALAVAIIPGLTQAMVKGRMDEAREKTGTIIKFCMIVAIPATIGIAVLGGPIVELLFNDSSEFTKHLMMTGSPYVLFYSLSAVLIGVLQGIDKMKEPIINAAISLAIHVVFVFVLLSYADMNIYAVSFTNIFYGFTMCALNLLSLRRYMGYRQELLKSFILPGIASGIMGFLTFIVYRVLLIATHHNSIACIVGILAAIVIYAAALILIRGITEEEIAQFPKGQKIVALLKKFRLM